ncbi:uncharacterized protein N7496_002503 [Penicillium cataractarum]|uniref:Calponin-homology (CH) domain-containing protein n=1 Tax=Penicillium cataractarum TaxID=2100454 RepID=A0A9W9SKI4_9EURO|nr:uncharacterized protein N7496_002503 [Penicillium cataractarum]KAJ5380075.1 hypothetical protein N7496_002503 [Penicillium cataractarum]
MASVTSLDKDLRNLRLSRYTPQAAAEVRDWIEEVLREKLPSSDLLEGLKDGVALCKLVNLAVSPGVKYKPSGMPFVQMENISHFLRACQMAPLNLPPHDVFLTVDLYESKDPAQVLQCLAAFSRRANALAPNKFPRTVGPQSKRGVISPNATGSSGSGSFTRNGRASSNASDANPSGSYSSWSKRGDEGATSPAWNIHQYGYMGGASQGNQGIAFGARRQITTPGPAVPSLAEKEKRRREEEERIRQENADREEAERIRQQQQEEEEARAKAEEQRRWEEETARMREKERQQMEMEKKRWDEEKRQWEEEEQRRVAEEKAAEERLDQERQRRRGANDARLNGQFLSQYQADQPRSVSTGNAAGLPEETPESRRIKELERELALAKEREQQYQSERQSVQPQEPQPLSQNRQRPAPVPPKPSYDLSSLEQERRMLRGEWLRNQEMPAASEEPETAEEEQAPPPPPRPLPEPVASPKPALPARDLPAAPRPLPDPVAYTASRGRENRVDRFLSSNPAPQAPAPSTHRPQDYSTTSEVDAENKRRIESQEKTRAGGWASKSLLEREMERERERQREWEENQKQTQAAARDPSMGSGPGQSWDVHQYGYMGGDNQNRGGTGLGIGGARRQIIGPRPPP